MVSAIGAPALRTEALGKVTGATRYTADYYLPGLLFARATRSPYAHARVKSIDAARALALPGVVAVITAADLPDRCIGRKLKDMPLLARDTVRFIGERVAVVAAADPVVAAEAAQMVDIDYEPLPPLLDPLAALAPDAPAIHPDLAGYAGLDEPPWAPNVCYRKVWLRGDPTAAMAAAAVVHAATYRTQSQHQSYIEPRACQAAIGPDGRVTFWTTNKSPYALRQAIAEYLDLPEAQLNIIATHIGGDFGGKGLMLAEPICYLLARRTGCPVRFSMGREEELLAGNPRHPALITIKAGVDRDGRLVAWQARAIFNSGAYAANNIRIGLSGAARAVGPYRIPNVELEALNVYTNVLHHGHMRAPGDPQSTFAAESHMTALAGQLGMDPTAFRLLNAVGRDDASPLGVPWRDNHLRETIRLAVDTHQLAGPPPPAPPGWLTGSAVACAERYNGMGESSATVRAEPDGTVTVFSGAVDVGSGAPTLFRQIAADELGVPLDQVRIVLGDTDAGPYDAGAGSSRHTPVAGSAVVRAALELRLVAGALAEERLECPPDLLAYSEGSFRVRGTPAGGRHEVTLAALARAAAERGIVLAGTAGVKMPMAAETCFAAAVADVAVDPATGQVRVQRIVSAHDVGKAMNPLGLRSQIEGAVLQGLGYALSEEVVIDDQGQVLTGTLTASGVPRTSEVPPVVAVWLEGARGPGPYGAKSAAEAALTPVVPAVAVAVGSAIGRSITSLPLTPEKVLSLLRVGHSAGGRS